MSCLFVPGLFHLHNLYFQAGVTNCRISSSVYSVVYIYITFSLSIHLLVNRLFPFPDNCE